jgi:hypothetical protein
VIAVVAPETIIRGEVIAARTRAASAAPQARSYGFDDLRTAAMAPVALPPQFAIPLPDALWRSRADRSGSLRARGTDRCGSLHQKMMAVHDQTLRKLAK